MTYLSHYDPPIGPMTMASDGDYLTGLWLDGQKHFGQGHTLESALTQELPLFTEIKEWLDLYFEGKNPSLPLSLLSPEGSPFQKLIWSELLEIPYGTTVTYGELSKKAAQALGKDSMSAQAVGGAVGHNPISILIPCHRVIGASGSLTGYAGGIDKKIFLLKLEGIPVDHLTIPTK